MVLEGLVQPQDGSTQGVNQPGPGDQVSDPSREAQPGAEEQSPNTFSQEEWDYREKAYIQQRANSDRQMAAQQNIIASGAMQQQIDEIERGHSAQDQQQISDGEITPEQAHQKQQNRFFGYQQQIGQRRASAQVQADHNRLEFETESMARTQVAFKLAEKYGVDAAVLESDMSLTTGPAMEVKADRLALDKERAGLKGTETFNSGQTGAKGAAISNMSPQEKISHGLAHPPRRGPR